MMNDDVLHRNDVCRGLPPMFLPQRRYNSEGLRFGSDTVGGGQNPTSTQVSSSTVNRSFVLYSHMPLDLSLTLDQSPTHLVFLEVHLLLLNNL